MNPLSAVQIYQTGGGGNRTLASEYSPFGELIPNLTQLALKNTNFSTTDALGGITQLSGTGWTIAGSISYLCGIPLNMPIGGNEFKNKHFLDSAVCVSDILGELGYKQAYFSNSDSSFGGNKFFFESHSIEVRDLPYFQAQNILPNPLPQNLQGIWGLKDAELLKLAKNHIENLSDSEPFALYISTIDTHSTENAWVDNVQCAGLDSSYASAIRCTDKIISDFVKWVQNSRFGENTTIIILGDHLSMESKIFTPSAKRFVYNAFINAKFSQKPRANLTKNRTLSHFDITPLILDSIGIRTKAFGLGRNPLYGETLLEHEFGIDDFNKSLMQRNKIYDSFWQVKKRE
ncbi:sulfatase-like hydrolase/transferase [Helicobacter sp. 23-1044]